MAARLQRNADYNGVWTMTVQELLDGMNAGRAETGQPTFAYEDLLRYQALDVHDGVVCYLFIFLFLCFCLYVWAAHRWI